MAMKLDALETEEQRLAAARSRCYQVLGAAFTYPDEWFSQAIRSGDVGAALRRALEAVAPALVEALDREALSGAGEGDDLAVEFTRLFDVGASGPPCPLHGGLYGGARMRVMEEAVRFYNHFGLQIDESERELPDHLQTELEFLHYLSFREAEALLEGGDPGAFRRGQRDFLARHPGRWVPLLRRRLVEQAPPPYFTELVTLLDRFLAHDRQHLLRLVGPPPPEATGRARAPAAAQL